VIPLVRFEPKNREGVGRVGGVGVMDVERESSSGSTQQLSTCHFCPEGSPHCGCMPESLMLAMFLSPAFLL